MSVSTSNALLKADKVWMDGKLIAWNEANVHVMTHALHYGLGVFEGIRCYKLSNGKSAVFRLAEHVERDAGGVEDDRGRLGEVQLQATGPPTAGELGSVAEHQPLLLVRGQQHCGRPPGVGGLAS